MRIEGGKESEKDYDRIRGSAQKEQEEGSEKIRILQQGTEVEWTGNRGMYGKVID